MGLLDRFFGPMSKDKFAQTLTDLIRKAGETSAITYDSEKGCLSKENGMLNLENAYREYSLADKAMRQKVVQKWVRAWFVGAKELPDEFEDVQPDLMPALRSRAYFELTDLRIKVETGKDTAWPHQPLANHFGLGLVYDMHEAMRTIQQQDLDEWGLSFYEAQEIAKENLRKLNHPFIGPKAGEGVYLSASRDSYDATRLLLLDIIRMFRVKGEPVAMIPNRDTLIVTGNDDFDGLQAMLALTKEAVNQPGYISTVALRLEEEDWVPWLPAPQHPLYDEFKLLRATTLSEDYDAQKELLDKLHAQQGQDIFVASFNAIQHEETSRVTTYTAWGNGITSWIPATDVVVFIADPEQPPRMYDWDRVLQAAGDLMEPLDIYPERYRITEFPAAEQFAAMGAERKM